MIEDSYPASGTKEEALYCVTRVDYLFMKAGTRKTWTVLIGPVFQPTIVLTEKPLGGHTISFSCPS